MIVGDFGKVLEEGHFGAHVIDQRAHGEHGVGFELSGTDELSDVIAGVSNYGTGFDVFIEGTSRLLGDRNEVLGLTRRDGMVQGVGGGNGTDQDDMIRPMPFCPSLEP